jgi:hypothetical protein
MQSKHVVLLLAITSVVCFYEATAQIRQSPANKATEDRVTEFSRKHLYASTVANMAKLYAKESEDKKPLDPQRPQKSRVWSVPHAPKMPSQSGHGFTDPGVRATFVGRTSNVVCLSCADGSQVYASLASLSDSDRNSIENALRPLRGNKKRAHPSTNAPAGSVAAP